MVAMASPPKSDKQQITIRVNAHFLGRLEKIGSTIGRNRSEMIDRAIEQFVMQHEQHIHVQHPPKPRH